jgi:hypothetical protein
MTDLRNEFFDLNTICYNRRNPKLLLNHWEVTDDVCEYCGLQKPQIYNIDSSPARSLPTRPASASVSALTPILISAPAPPLNPPPPPRVRTATAPAISISNLRVGAGNTGRNEARRAQTTTSPKKQQSTYISFHLKIARFVYDEHRYPVGWFQSTGSWSKTLFNTTTTSDELLNALYNFLDESVRTTSE